MFEKKSKKRYATRPPSLTGYNNPEVVVCGEIQLSSEVTSVVGLAQLLLDLLEKKEVTSYLYEVEMKKKKGVGLG